LAVLLLLSGIRYPNVIFMFRNYLRLAYRNIRNNKFYSFINIAGLSLSTAVFLLIISFILFENSYEGFHKKADDLYRVTLDSYRGAEFVVSDAETSPPLAPALQQELPEVKATARVQMMEEVREVGYRHESFHVDRLFAADPSVFSLFSFTPLKGDAVKALSTPLQAVVTETTAKRIFGSVDAAIGQALEMRGQMVTVAAVMKDVPPNTHLKINMLVSFVSIEKWGYRFDRWGACNNYTYVQLAKGVNLAAFNKKMQALFEKRTMGDKPVAEPLKDIHLHSRKTYEPEVNGDAKTVQFLLTIAILILLVGAVNYVNLTTARSAERAREVGIRKTLGSSRWLLARQFLAETLVINMLALALSLLIFKLSLPAFYRLTGLPEEADLLRSTAAWVIIPALFLLNCLLSGLYPALVVSSYKPISVASRTFTSPTKGNALRKVLVVSQLTAALVVVSASLIIYRQLSFLQHHDLGMNLEEMLVVRASQFMRKDSAQHRQSLLFKQALQQLPEVKRVAVSGAVPGLPFYDFAALGGIGKYGEDNANSYIYYLYGIDADFIPAMELQVVAGRNFRPGGLNKDEVIVSEDAARLMGFSKPAAAIGQRITYGRNGGTFSTIVGVIGNYHQQSLKGPILPMILPYDEANEFFSVKLASRDLPKTIAAIERAYKTVYPGHAFEYHFLNEMFDQQYKADQKFGSIVGIFSGFTLLITCLGILGLTAYSITRRRKEIGIRKVLGASISGIVGMFSKDFARLVLIASVVATPLAWYAMHLWLQDFAYRTEISWWIFAVAALAISAIALLTVSFQSVKAALMNPVKALRTE
jgi:putative ABC transport system permease protein